MIEMTVTKSKIGRIFSTPVPDRATHKTKDFISMLNQFDLKNEKITLITGNMDNNNNLYLSSKNLEKINLVRVDSFSTYDVMNCNYLLVDKSGIEYINENLGK